MTILAEISGWGSIMEDVLLVIHIVVCLLLCLVVLMQRPKQEGLGAAFGGGMTDQAFGARTTDVLQKGTVYLASILFIITLILSILVSSKSEASSILKENQKNSEAAIDENVDAAAALLAGEEELTAEDVAEAVQKATDAGENKPAEEADAEGEKAEETPAETETPEQ